MDCSGKKQTGNPVKRLFVWWHDHGRIWLGLCLLTLFLWQFRFVRCGPNLLAAHVCESLDAWEKNGRVLPELARADEEGLQLIKRRNEPTFSLTRPLDGIDQVSYVAVTCDASWENAVPHPEVRWLGPRVVIVGYDEKNRFCASLDHGIVSADGTKNWHRIQTVMQLPVELKKVILSIDAFGQEGILRLRNLRVEPVRQRVWFVPATVLLLAAWAWALSRLLLPHISGQWVLIRAFLIACGILFGAWFFVFPQGRTMFPSLVGDFLMGPAIVGIPVMPVEEKQLEQAAENREKPVVAKSNSHQPRLRTINPAVGSENQISKSPNPALPNPITIAPQERQKASLGLWLRALDRKWNWKNYNLTHFTAFFGIGFFVFGLAGSGRIWPLPAGIALLGEIIPNLIYHTWDRGDWWDLAANISGLVAAMITLLGVRKWISRKRSAHPVKVMEVI